MEPKAEQNQSTPSTNRNGQANNTEEVGPGKSVYRIMGSTFVVDSFYELTHLVGRGAYGVVAKGINKETNRPIAIKKVSDIFANPIDAKRLLRELHILKFLNHKNIISLLDIVHIEDQKTFNHAYIVMELMQNNLTNVIKSKNVFTEEHIRFFIYQILNGIYFMHSASIVHRDIKPQNIFVNKKCELKIGDLNMARKLTEEEQSETFYVMTRWYRAPEVLLSSSMYTKAVDIWSAGCILAELIGRVPIFMGNSYLDQFLAIVAVMGRPKPEDFENDPHVTYNLTELVKGIPQRDKIDMRELFPKADVLCLDLLDHMLEYNPKKRYTVEECLNHPYLEKFRKFERVKCTTEFDFSFDKVEHKQSVLRQQIYNFACQFRAEKSTTTGSQLPEISLKLSQSQKSMEESQNIKRGRSVDIDKEDRGPTKLHKGVSEKPQRSKERQNIQ